MVGLLWRLLLAPIVLCSALSSRDLVERAGASGASVSLGGLFVDPRICSQGSPPYSEADAATPIPAATMHARPCTTQRLVRAECIKIPKMISSQQQVAAKQQTKGFLSAAYSWRGQRFRGLSAKKTPAAWHLLLQLIP